MPTSEQQRRSEYSPFSTAWQYRDSVRLCEHVQDAGAAQWDALGESLMCPAALCALKWHVLVLEHMRIKIPKWYSDWELCVLYVACETGLSINMSKASIYAVMASWMPGRTAAGLKQAYTANFASADVATDKVAALLKKNGWQSDLLALMEAWPGPHEAFKGPEDDKVVAAEILTNLQEKGPTMSATSSGRRTSTAAVAAAATAAAAAAGSSAATGNTPPPSPGVTSPAPAAAAQFFGAARDANLAAGLAASPALMAPTLLSHSLAHNSGMLPPLSSGMPSGNLSAGDDMLLLQQQQQQQQACGYAYSGLGPLRSGASHPSLRGERSSSLPPPNLWQQQPAVGQHMQMDAAHRSASTGAGGVSSSMRHTLPGGAAVAGQQPQHWQMLQQQQQGLNLGAGYYNVDAAGRAAAYAAGAPGADAAAAGGRSSPGPIKFEFDLPEVDASLRQVLEQQLDAALQGQLETGLMHSHLSAAAAAAAGGQGHAGAASAPASMDISQGLPVLQQQGPQEGQFQAAAAAAGALPDMFGGPPGLPITSAPELSFELPSVSTAMPKRQRMQDGYQQQPQHAYAAATTQTASRLSTLRVDSPAAGPRASSFPADVLVGSRHSGSPTLNFGGQQQQQQQGGDSSAWDPQMLLLPSPPGDAACAGLLGPQPHALLPHTSMQLLRPAHSAPEAVGQQQHGGQERTAGTVPDLMLQQLGGQQQAWQQEQGPGVHQLLQGIGAQPAGDVLASLVQRVQLLEEQQQAMQQELNSLKTQRGPNV